MKTHQQIKSLEYEASLIGSKELAESKNSEVADKESKLRENCKALFIECVSTFLGPVQLLFIP